MTQVVASNQNVSFTYEKESGEVKTVEGFHVDRVFTSNAGHRIVQGWLRTGEGRSYRAAQMSEVRSA